MKKIITAWKKIKIKNQIIITYISILIISFILTVSVIWGVNSKYTKQEIGQAGVQTVNALKGNLSFVFDNITKFSNLIYFDDNIQESLKKINSASIDLNHQKSIKKSLVNMILSGEYISSAVIFDKYNNSYESYKRTPRAINGGKIFGTDWYKKTKQTKGNGFFMHQSEGIIEFYGDNDYISYVRQIGDKDTYSPLATLLITVDARTIQNCFTDISEEYNSQFFIVDSNNKLIIKPQQDIKDYEEYLVDEKESSAEYIDTEIGGKRSIIVSDSLGIQDWKLVGAFQVDGIIAMSPYYTTVVVIVMLLNFLFVIVSSMILTSLIFTPLSKVEKHMKLVEKGEFVKMTTDSNDNEINSLKKVFNHMINSIQELIKQVKSEEQIIAKGKLDIIQAQINPHFLYNTLDAVSALALMEDNENCFKITQALGNFYRNSLNSGQDFVTVKDEIDCIKSYITILNMRYDNNIKVTYEVQRDLLEEKVLKLLLQPVVENAVHHGLRGRIEEDLNLKGRAKELDKREGKILIKVYTNDDDIILQVLDNGVGMGNERIEEVMSGKAITGKSGFGIYSLIQRISLYYGMRNPVEVQSEIGKGTEVTIKIGYV